MYGFDLVIDVAPLGGQLNDTQVCPSACPTCNMFVGPGYTATPGVLYSVNRFKDFAKTFVVRTTEPIER